MDRFRNVLGMVSEPDLLLPGFTVRRQNDPMDGLFDDQSTNNLMARWNYLESQYRIPQMAQFHAFDSVAQKSIRVPIDEKSVEKGLIKVKRCTSELLDQLIKQGVREEDELYSYVIDDSAAMAEEVVTRTKVAKSELMATGKVTIKENDLDLTIDYGVPQEQTSLTLDLGPGAEKSVPDQLLDLTDMAADAGVSIQGMVCSKTTLSKLRRNPEIQKIVNGVSMEGALLSADSLRNFLSSEYDISRVVTSDDSYSLPYTVGEDGRPEVHKMRYFPKDVCTFFGTGPGEKLGTGLWGVPPEVRLSSFGGNATSQSGQSPYVYMHQWTEDDPAVVWTKASALFMPVLYNPNSLFISKVVETPAG